jgi:hypothetical protein
MGWFVDEGVDAREPRHLLCGTGNTGEIQDQFATRQEAEQWIRTNKPEAEWKAGLQKMEPVHTLDITPELRCVAIEQGFALLQPAAVASRRRASP